MFSSENEDYNDFKDDTNKKINLINKKLNRLEDKINIIIDNYENQHLLNKKIENIEKTLLILIGSNEEILKKINNNNIIESESKNIPKRTIKNVRIEQFNISKNIILECLNMHSLEGDIKLFKILYLNDITKDFYPLRYLNKKEYQYMNDNKWNNDTNGSYIKEIILKKNIARCYLKVNTIDNVKNNNDFIENQQHISKILDEKYQEKWLNKIKNLIKI
jgi:hypothetical protein